MSASLSAFEQEIEDMYSDYEPPKLNVPILPKIHKVHTALIIGANNTEPHIQTFMSQHPDYTVITWSTDSTETDTHINKDINDDSYLDVFQHIYKGAFKMIIIDKSTTKFIVNFNVYIKLKESLTEDGHIFIPLFGSSPGGGNAFEMIKRVPEFRLVLNTELKDFHDYFELSVYEGFVFLLSEDMDGYYFDHLNILASLGKHTEQEVMANIFQNIFRDKSFQSKINRLNQIHFFTSLDAIGFVIEEDFDFSHYPLFNPRYETPTSFIKIKKYRPIEFASIEDRPTRYESLMADFSHRYPRENNPSLKSFYIKWRSSLGKRRKSRKSRTRK